MNVSGIDACHRDLFTDVSELRERYNEDMVQKILRCRDMFLHFQKTPSCTDSELIRTFTQRYKISRPTAYSDLAVVKVLLPMLREQSREFHKWRSLEMLFETYKIAKAKMDPRSMERIASTYARVSNADQPDEEKIDLEKIIPVQWVSTDDPTVLGLPRLPDRERKIRELLREFRAKDPEIIDIKAEEADLPL